jgi:hypothetical protein
MPSSIVLNFVSGFIDFKICEIFFKRQDLPAKLLCLGISGCLVNIGWNFAFVSFKFFNMIFIASLNSFIQVLTLIFCLHPMHVSVTEIEFDEKEKELEIMMRVFVDDMELTMRNKLHQPELDILEPKNGMTIDQMGGDYIKEHFKIWLDNKPQKIGYLGHERESDAFIFYIQVSSVKKWKTIQVQNDIIMEMHDDQSNLVHVTVRDKVLSLRLTKSTPVDKLTF